jgi:hypothetical protein
MYIRTATATALVAAGLFATLATAGTAVAAASVAPVPCAQEQLVLMNAEDALANVDASPEVKKAYDAMMKASAAAGLDKLSQNMVLAQLGANTSKASKPVDPALQASAAKALESYTAAESKYLQVRDAALSKVAPQRQSSREAFRKCLNTHAS